MFKYIINRLTERSSWLGFIALATSCGAAISTELTEPIITISVALASHVGIFRGKEYFGDHALYAKVGQLCKQFPALHMG